MATFTRLLVIAFSVGMLSGCRMTGRPASLSFSPRSIDLGKLYTGQVIGLKTKLENGGDQPAALKKISGSCDCLVPHQPLPNSVAPRSAVEIQATFNSLGFVGNVSRDILAEPELGGAPAFCEVRSQVCEAVRYPANVNLTIVPLGQTVRRSFSFEAVQLDADKLHLTAVSSSNMQTLHATDWTRLPLSRGQKGTLEYTMEARQSGRFYETLWLEFDLPVKLKLGYEVHALVSE